MWPRRKRHSTAQQTVLPESPLYRVQLVAIDDDGHVLNTWAPIYCTESYVNETVRRLRRDNQWGMPGRWPNVQVALAAAQDKGADE